jgi:hypothetical protein
MPPGFGSRKGSLVNERLRARRTSWAASPLAEAAALQTSDLVVRAAGVEPAQRLRTEGF